MRQLPLTMLPKRNCRPAPDSRIGGEGPFRAVPSARFAQAGFAVAGFQAEGCLGRRAVGDYRPSACEMPGRRTRSKPTSLAKLLLCSHPFPPHARASPSLEHGPEQNPEPQSGASTTRRLSRGRGRSARARQPRKDAPTPLPPSAHLAEDDVGSSCGGSLRTVCQAMWR